MHTPFPLSPEAAPEAASMFRNVYSSVAAQLDVDPEFVVRVALGNQHSSKIETALENELKRIVEVLKSCRKDHGGRVIRMEPRDRDFGLPDSTRLPDINANARAPFKFRGHQTGH
jgi:hypothetical protein